MKSFCVVHLSDLHVRVDEDPGQARVREALVQDLTSLVREKGLRVDALAVTGDSVDRGGTPGAFAISAGFYRSVLNALGLSPDRLLIVPGNHDVPRRGPDRALLAALSSTPLDSAHEAKEYWESLEPRFRPFQDFCTDALGPGLRTGIFGAAMREISNGACNVRFVLLNSAWSSIGNDDYGKLMISRWQLESLEDPAAQSTAPDLTLALLHHPLDWFQPSERDVLIGHLKSGTSLSCDAILHGHVHAGSVNMFADPDGSLLSLVSGIGYPDLDRQPGRPKLSQCRYAVYRWRVDEGLLDVWLRISRADGGFSADTLLYKRGAESGNFTISFRSGLGETTKERLTPQGKVELDPVPYIADWVGREDELRELSNRKLRLVAITGIGGQGKSGLAAEFRRRHERGTEAFFDLAVWADCRELPHSLHTKIIDLLAAVTNGEESPERFKDETVQDTAKRLVRHLQRRRLLVVLDNVDAYVRPDLEEPTDDLQPFFNAVLNNEHESLVMLTCRLPLNDPRGSFRHFPLGGLTPSEGAEFIRKRLGRLEGHNSEDDCRLLVERTSGHPWWLGLIAGQVVSKQDTIRNWTQRYGRGQANIRSRIADYFGDVWKQLNKVRQRMLRNLVEAPRPLTDMEIAQVLSDLGPDKISRETRRLARLGLVDPHTSQAGVTVYQVHPLVRELVHESYKPEAQRPFVVRVLCVFLPKSVVVNLFANASALDQISTPSKSIPDLAYSIEACLDSRNALQALELLERYGHLLYDNGYHHRFQSLGSRVLDALDWHQTRLAERERGSELLGAVVSQLSQMGEVARADYYLRRFEASVEANTPGFLKYLSLAAFIAWQNGEFGSALKLLDAFDASARKQKTPTSLKDIKNTRALALRDTGRCQEALDLFRSIGGTRKHGYDASDAGNIARCLMKVQQYDEAEELLAQSLVLLLQRDDLWSKTNRGYAYLWIAELCHAQGLIKEAVAFLRLGNVMWTEYAPGLLRIANKVKEQLGLSMDSLSDPLIDEARKTERLFLDRSAWLKQKTETIGYRKGDLTG